MLHRLCHMSRWGLSSSLRGFACACGRVLAAGACRGLPMPQGLGSRSWEVGRQFCALETATETSVSGLMSVDFGRFRSCLGSMSRLLLLLPMAWGAQPCARPGVSYASDAVPNAGFFSDSSGCAKSCGTLALRRWSPRSLGSPPRARPTPGRFEAI